MSKVYNSAFLHSDNILLCCHLQIPWMYTYSFSVLCCTESQNGFKYFWIICLHVASIWLPYYSSLSSNRQALIQFVYFFLLIFITSTSIVILIRQCPQLFLNLSRWGLLHCHFRNKNNICIYILQCSSLRPEK